MRKYPVFLSVVLLSAVMCTGCSFDQQEKTDKINEQSNLSSRINNGSLTLNYPEVGAIYTTQLAQPHCSGVLVAPDVILTARHCNCAGILLFVHNYLTPLARTIVKSYVVPGAASSADAVNDLTVNIIFPPIYEVAPAVINGNFSYQNNGSMATMVGYGMDYVHLDPLPGRKRLGQAEAQSISGKSFTLKSYESFLFINTSKVGLLGDSGGGVYDNNNRLVGILFSVKTLDWTSGDFHYTYAHNLGDSTLRKNINNLMEQAYKEGVRRQYDYDNWKTLQVK